MASLSPWRIVAGWTWLSGMVLGAVLVAGCAHAPVHHDPILLAATATTARDARFAQWLGVSSWIISRGSEAVVVDPFFSRPSLLRVAVAHILPFVAFVPNVERINAVMPRLPNTTRLVLVGHGPRVRSCSTKAGPENSGLGQGPEWAVTALRKEADSPQASLGV